MEKKDTDPNAVAYIPEKIECKDDENSNISYIFSKPEILKMHLDILYKTVNFLDRAKIMQGLPEYKESKRLR